MILGLTTLDGALSGFTYDFHGARLRSNRLLEGPHLVSEGSDVDLRLQLSDAHETGAIGSPGTVLPWLPPGLDCRLEQTSPMTLHVSSGLPENETAGLLFSGVLPSLLAHSGALVLRGAAVLCPTGALLLVGGAMAGKSTAAVALARQGFPVISDDVVVLREADGETRVAEGPAWIKLWPEGADPGNAIGEPVGPVRTGLGKQQFRRPPLPAGNARSAPRAQQFPVARVCLLNPCDVPRAVAAPLSPQALLAALSDFQRSPVGPIGSSARAAQFKILAALARLPQPLVVHRPSELPLSADYGPSLRQLLVPGDPR